MIRVTILGCGSSGGVPRLGGVWGDCDPSNPRNRRRRSSILVQRQGREGTTQIVIDTGPDFAHQMLDTGVAVLDAVIYTHPHADHIHGIDDVRQLVFNSGQMMPVWADEPTSQALLERFGYIFETPPGSQYPPVCALNRIDGEIRINGAGGLIRLDPFEVRHGNIPALGFRIRGEGAGGLVYLPDVSSIPPEAWSYITGAEVFICDALRRTPHPSHAHLARTLDWFARAGTPHCVITNMHLDMDYDAVMADTPANVEPAYDGMVLEVAA